MMDDDLPRLSVVEEKNLLRNVQFDCNNHNYNLG